MPERTVTPDQTPAPAPTSTQQQPPPSPPEWAGAAERIERIEAMLDEAGPAAVELVKELLALYGEGLARILALAGEAVAVEVAADELVSPCFCCTTCTRWTPGPGRRRRWRGSGARSCRWRTAWCASAYARRAAAPRPRRRSSRPSARWPLRSTGSRSSRTNAR
ncbi:hypothetical protein ACFQYP_08650 [Nonomuraea antimicrobica]